MVPHLEIEILDKLLGDQQDPLAEDSLHLMPTPDPQRNTTLLCQTLTELAVGVVCRTSNELTKALCGRSFIWGLWIHGTMNKVWRLGHWLRLLLRRPLHCYAHPASFKSFFPSERSDLQLPLKAARSFPHPKERQSSHAKHWLMWFLAFESERALIVDAKPNESGSFLASVPGQIATNHFLIFCNVICNTLFIMEK